MGLLCDGSSPCLRAGAEHYDNNNTHQHLKRERAAYRAWTRVQIEAPSDSRIKSSRFIPCTARHVQTQIWQTSPRGTVCGGTSLRDKVTTEAENSAHEAIQCERFVLQQRED